MNSFGDWSRKLSLYLRAALETRSINWRGLPILPKTFLSDPPYNRASYNEFLLWIRQSIQLRDASIVFDIGANHGDFAKAASACFSSAQIFLFEPLPNLQSELQSQASRYGGRWHIEPIALGASNSVLPFHVDPTNDAIGSFTGFSSSYNRVTGSRDPAVIDVQVETLDDFCRKRNINHIDLTKIDVEGFEFDVLKGARSMLPNISALIVETSLIRTADGKPTPLLDIVQQLTECGFYIVALFPMFSREGDEQWRPCEYNVLARKSAKPA
jgi:FkbM family methyltransferase